jgi:hypothetical protein
MTGFLTYLLVGFVLYFFASFYYPPKGDWKMEFIGLLAWPLAIVFGIRRGWREYRAERAAKRGRDRHV